MIFYSSMFTTEKNDHFVGMKTCQRFGSTELCEILQSRRSDQFPCHVPRSNNKLNVNAVHENNHNTRFLVSEVL